MTVRLSQEKEKRMSRKKDRSPGERRINGGKTERREEPGLDTKMERSLRDECKRQI